MFEDNNFSCCSFCKYADPFFPHDFLVFCTYRGFAVPYDYFCSHFEDFVT